MRNCSEITYRYSEMNAFRRLRQEKEENTKREKADLKSKMSYYVINKNNYDIGKYLE